MNKYAKARLVRKRWDEGKRWKRFIVTKSGTVLDLSANVALKQGIRRDARGRLVICWSSAVSRKDGAISYSKRKDEILRDVDTFKEAMDLVMSITEEVI